MRGCIRSRGSWFVRLLVRGGGLVCAIFCGVWFLFVMLSWLGSFMCVSSYCTWLLCVKCRLGGVVLDVCLVGPNS